MQKDAFLLNYNIEPIINQFNFESATAVLAATSALL